MRRVTNGMLGLSLLLAAGGVWAAEKPQVEQYLRLGSQAVKQHDYQQAMVYFQKALEADPESAAANSGLGNLYAGMQRCEQGLPYLEKALQIDSKDETALFGMGVCYMDVHQHEKAIPYLQQVLHSHPHNRGVIRVLAYAYVRRGAMAGQQGQHQQARASLQAALKLFQQLGDQHSIDDMTRALKEIPD